MEHGNYTVFEGFEAASEVLSTNLKLYGIKAASLFKNAEGKLVVGITGKCPKPVADLIAFKPGETLGDYEGIDDATKETGYVFPMDMCTNLMIDVYGFDGRFVEIMSEEQDPISGEVLKDLYYIQRETSEEDLGYLVTEYIEAAINMVDGNDDTESVLQTMFETFNQILDLTGNKNLQEEVNRRLLEIL